MKAKIKVKTWDSEEKKFYTYSIEVPFPLKISMQYGTNEPYIFAYNIKVSEIISIDVVK